MIPSMQNAMTLIQASLPVLTVEHKMNLLAPADGEKLIARGKVVRPGRTLIVTQAEVFAVRDGKETLCLFAVARWRVFGAGRAVRLGRGGYNLSTLASVAQRHYEAVHA